MRALVVQHDDDKPLGLFEEPLRAGGLVLETRRAGDDPLALAGHAAVIALPGFANPVDDTRAIRDTRSLIADALAGGVPVLGICLGSQLLAQAAGASAAACTPEYGFAPVAFTPAAGDDPLLAGVPASLEVFHAHGYAVGLPDGAEALAHTEGVLQAFRVGGTAWGFQFHPEPGIELIDLWAGMHRERLAGMGIDPTGWPATVRRLEMQTRAFAERTAGRFADIVRERARPA